VPLDDIAADGSRVYYGMGDMRTPRNYENFLRSNGAIIKKITVHSTYHKYRYYDLRLGNKDDLTSILINDLTSCKFTMGVVEPMR
jgi:hypothetical protein